MSFWQKEKKQDFSLWMSKLFAIIFRHWKDHFKSDLRSDQVHRQKNDLRSDQEDHFF
jgi:peptide deformylase